MYMGSCTVNSWTLDQATKFTTNEHVHKVADENATELSLIDYSTCTLTAADVLKS